MNDIRSVAWSIILTLLPTLDQGTGDEGPLSLRISSRNRSHYHLINNVLIVPLFITTHYSLWKTEGVLSNVTKTFSRPNLMPPVPDKTFSLFMSSYPSSLERSWTRVTRVTRKVQPNTLVKSLKTLGIVNEGHNCRFLVNIRRSIRKDGITGDSEWHRLWMRM